MQGTIPTSASIPVWQRFFDRFVSQKTNQPTRAFSVAASTMFPPDITSDHIRRLSTFDSGDANCRIELKYEAECVTDVATVGPAGASAQNPLVAALSSQLTATTLCERSTSLQAMGPVDAVVNARAESPRRIKTDPTHSVPAYVPNDTDIDEDDVDDDAMYSDGLLPENVNSAIWKTDSAYGSSPPPTLSNSSSLDDCRTALRIPTPTTEDTDHSSPLIEDTARDPLLQPSPAPLLDIDLPREDVCTPPNEDAVVPLATTTTRSPKRPSPSRPAWRRVVDDDIRAEKERREKHTHIRKTALMAKEKTTTSPRRTVAI